MPGANGVDFVLPNGYRVFLRAREASTGAALRMDEDVRFLARTERRRAFWPAEPVSGAPDVDGWYECGINGREADVLAVPRGLPAYGTRLVEHVRLDGPTPARVEFVLERGADVTLELAEGVAPWPAENELLLVETNLWVSFYRAGRGRWQSPFEGLEAQCAVRFDEHGKARLRGLAPGEYRFKAMANDVQVEPEFVRVERDALPVRVRWSRRE